MVTTISPPHCWQKGLQRLKLNIQPPHDDDDNDDDNDDNGADYEDDDDDEGVDDSVHLCS